MLVADFDLNLLALQMHKWKWDYQSPLVGMQWISFGELACILQSGLVLIYSLNAEAPTEVQLQIPRGQLLAACQFSHRSAVLQISNGNDLVAVADVARPEVTPLAPLNASTGSVGITSLVCRSNAVKDVRAHNSACQR